jgi:DNA mismatch repair protein MutS
MSNLHLNATEYGEKIVFLHKVKSGPASQSYGIQVAKLAGVPNAVIAMAKEKLYELESQSHQSAAHKQMPQQTQLFMDNPESPAVTKLKKIKADNLTPREALDILYELITLAKD